MIFKIAWRNIGRNKRRTLLTAASIFFAVFFSCVMTSINRGVFDKMIDDSVTSNVGYIQIHKKGFWDDQVINNAMVYDQQWKQELAAIDKVQTVIPRLQSAAMISFGKITKNVLVTGIDPAAENKLTNISNRVVDGEYLNADDQAVLIGEGLAKKLKATIGDTLILLSQGYRGVNAAQVYPIKGIVSFGVPALSSGMVYMPLAAAQYFYGANNLTTAVVLDVAGKEDVEEVLPPLYAKLDTNNTYEVMAWQEMIPDILNLKQTKDSSNKVVTIILYFIVGFGIFGTILMMTRERQYEFGVLLSIGMKRGQLAASVWIETLLLGLLGAVVGIALAYGLAYYLMVNPIVMQGEMAEAYTKFGMDPVMPASVALDIFWEQALTVLTITTLIALYPAFVIFRLQPVTAMRS